jgi:hypothetical protein
VVNFNLRLAQLAAPEKPWQIVTSLKHSTVWDGDQTLFNMNFLAFGIGADEAFRLANEEQLPPGQERECGAPVLCPTRPRRRKRRRSGGQAA